MRTKEKVNAVEHKVSISVPALRATMRAVAPCVSKRSSHPVLKGVLLRAIGDRLDLTSCNGESWLRASGNLTGIGELATIVDHKRLYSFLSECDGIITLTKEGSLLHGESGSFRFKLLALPVDEFPVVPVVEGVSTLTSLGEVRRVKDTVGYCASDDMSRAYLTGVSFEPGKAIATDTHRLAVTSFRCEGPFSGIAPMSLFGSLYGLKATDDASVLLTTGSYNRLKAECDGIEYVGQFLSGVYPSWKRVVPESFDKSWTFDRLDLIKAVRSAMLMAKDNVNRVRFTGSGTTVKVTGWVIDRGECSATCVASVTGGQTEIAFNGRYVLETLRSMDSEGVVFQMQTPSSPMTIVSVPGDETLTVVMPMALG